MTGGDRNSRTESINTRTRMNGPLRADARCKRACQQETQEAQDTHRSQALEVSPPKHNARQWRRHLPRARPSRNSIGPTPCPLRVWGEAARTGSPAGPMSSATPSEYSSSSRSEYPGSTAAGLHHPTVRLRESQGFAATCTLQVDSSRSWLYLCRGQNHRAIHDWCGRWQTSRLASQLISPGGRKIRID